MHERVPGATPQGWCSLILLLAAMATLSALPVLATATATDLPEKSVTAIADLAGIWKGAISGGADMELTIAPDGTWTNVLTGGGTFVGIATIADGRVRSRSDTTGRAYFWRLHEGGKRRVLVFLNDPDESVAATVEFQGRQATGATTPKNPTARAPNSRSKTPEVALVGCISKMSIHVAGPESVSIPGVLYCPERVGAAPAVVLLPPTAGATTHVFSWGEWLASEGYIALVLDSDAGRPTVTPYRTRTQDANAAAALLRAAGLVDGDRAAVLGFSIGGAAALEAAGERIPAGSAQYRFRAAIALYPSCAAFRSDTSIPLLLLLGGSDTVTPPAGCLTAAQQLKDAGKDISWVLYPDAHHGFDVVGAPGGMRTPWGHVQYDARAAADARHRVAAFLARTLGNSAR